jgi:hypothetical protein
MSTLFRKLEIPPGVVATATKQMNSTNWAEVNLMRWVEGQLSPVGGQSAYTYQFASRCRAIHSWFGLDQIYRTAYLCETNIYIDQGGVLTDITPADGMTAPAPLNAGGYGTGLYSASTYGTPRPPGTALPSIHDLPGVYSLDNFGSILFAMTSLDTRLLTWDPAIGGKAIKQTGAPLGRCFVVTPERFIQIFGQFSDGTTDGGSARRFGWCNQGDPSSWDFADVTSQAGYLDVEPASPIVSAMATRHGTVFWTAKTTYMSQFVGLPYVYNYNWLAENCTPWSPESAVMTSAYAFWMSSQGMFTFDGTNVWPVSCGVRSWINDDIDLENVREQACAVHVSNFNEFWWFFPQNGQQFNTRVVIYNYKEGWWSQGTMSRSAGVTASYTTNTIMADGLTAYQHELGTMYPSNVPLPWAETFDLNITPNGNLITIKQMLPDIKALETTDPKTVANFITNLRYSLFYRNSRSLGSAELQTAPRSVRTDGYVDFRTTGRDIRLKIELAGPNVWPITVGQHLVDATLRGDR